MATLIQSYHNAVLDLHVRHAGALQGGGLGSKWLHVDAEVELWICVGLFSGRRGESCSPFTSMCDR